MRLGLAGIDRVTVHPLYEDFKPVTEWKHEEGFDAYLVYLPDFTKEQLKVASDGYGGLKISGERLVGGGTKCIRFLDEVRVPDNCFFTEIRAKLGNGVLRISMPKNLNREEKKQSQLLVWINLQPLQKLNPYLKLFKIKSFQKLLQS